MEKIAFPYRSASHLALLHVIAEAGSWEKYGLEVDYDRPISRSDAHSAVSSGEIEFVGGNHVSTYGRQARGDNWVYLGQTVNSDPGRQLVVRADSEINSVADLRHKTVGTSGNHPSLNDWLFLKQHGLDVDRDEIVLRKRSDEDKAAGNSGLWQQVRDGKIDAAFISPPKTLFAKRAGLKLIAIDPLPMIFFTTISSSLPFVQKHPKIVEAFIKGLIEGIHFFKTQPARSIATIRTHYTYEGQLDDEAATLIYDSLAPALEPKLYPTPQAIANVYLEGIRQDKDAAKINPMELWDLQFLRSLDNAGFGVDLYRPQPR
jgi:ABC-type nitrate/sulfonate/bicarbonate transport system substrate-binding protein